MELTGLLDNIVLSVADIDSGRKGFATNGEEHEGRLYYERGIAGALAAFTEAANSANPHTIMVVEEAFVEQDLQ